MEFARTSGLSECKRLRSSESRWPRLRAVVGPRPKAARQGEIYIYHQLPISLSTYLPTQLPTSLSHISTHRSIYLLPPVELTVPGLARFDLAVPDHMALPGPGRSIGLRKPWPGRQGLPWPASACAWPFLRQRTVTFRPAGESRGCPTRSTQGDPLAATPFAGGLPG